MIKEDILTTDDLIGSVKEVLNRRGVIDTLKARIRAEVYHTLEEKSIVGVPPKKPLEVYLASEIVRDFLMSMKLDCSLSVFCQENGQPSEMNVDRAFIGEELGYNMTALGVTATHSTQPEAPLLVLLIQSLMKQKDIREMDSIRALSSREDS